MPSIVPIIEIGPLYLVLCDYGRHGLSFYEADPDKSDRETVIRWMKEGQYENPKQVIEINLAAGTSRDVTQEIFEEVEERARAAA